MQESKTVGKFQLTNRLGEGAFAVVYKGNNLQTKQIVAVKKMKKMTKQDAEMVKKEINIMKQLKHKNIIQYKEDFRDKGDWYIVLQYCGKGDLEEYKKKVGKIPEYHCKLFVQGILEALVELHKRKIAHRDLKLANILITNDYKLKLADFGFSKDYESGYMKSFCGTPLSMAPQILKRDNYNQKCDVWSLGVLTFMMLYNKPPFFPTKAEGIGIPGITIAVTNRNHKFDSSVQVSDAGKKFMNDCLKKNMNDRPTTAELLNHEWFRQLYANNISRLRTEAIKSSYQDEGELMEKEAFTLCSQMIFGVFEEHLKKIAQQMQLNSEIICKIKDIYQKYYKENRKILQCYFLSILKRLKNLSEREVIYIVRDNSFKIPLQKLKRFGEFEKEIAKLAQSEMKEMTIGKNDKINIERQIINFCLTETEMLMESQNDEEMTEKMYLVKNLCKIVTTDFDNTMIDIKWGERADFEKYHQSVLQFLEKLNEDIIIKVINEEPNSDEDLEATWLIENQIKQNVAAKKSIQMELGKLALYILGIPTNFAVDKNIITEKITLNDENYWPMELKW